jgi:hypothetical protein
MIDGDAFKNIVNNFISEYDHHERVRISSCTQDEFISILLKDQNLMHKSDIEEYFREQSEYVQDKYGLYFVRHLKWSIQNPLCVMVCFPKSSFVWWEEMKAIAENNIANIPDFLQSAVIWKAQIDQKLIPYEEKFAQSIQEIPNRLVVHYINYSININGWEKENPPYKIFIFGEDELPMPRFAGNNFADGEGCAVKIQTYMGEIVGCTIVEGGSGYVVDDNLELMTNFGKRGSLIVRQVQDGVVISAEVLRKGAGYKNEDIINTFTNKYSVPFPCANDKHPSLEDNLPFSLCRVLLPD